jgi:DNA adenine methylase
MAHKKMIAFGYFGGKFSHLDWLLPLLPKCHHFVDVYGGSAAVILNRDPSPIDTYNDLDGDNVNFFRVLREKGDELIELLKLTPFSREEFALACQREVDLTDLEKARRFYVRLVQARAGMGQSAQENKWAYTIIHSRRGMASTMSRWETTVKGLTAVLQRLLRIQVENLPALKLIRRYGENPNVLLYCDPPYVHSSRTGGGNVYAFEMNDQQHRKLAKRLNACKAKVAVSGYATDLYEELYPAPQWRKNVGPLKTAMTAKEGKNSKRQEILWTNYNPLERNGLFRK